MESTTTYRTMTTRAALRALASLCTLLVFRALAAVRTWLITPHAVARDDDPQRLTLTGWQLIVAHVVAFVVAVVLSISW